MTSKTDKELVFTPGGNGAPPAEEQELLPALDDMTPREIVAELESTSSGSTRPSALSLLLCAIAFAARNFHRRLRKTFFPRTF